MAFIADVEMVANFWLRSGDVNSGDVDPPIPLKLTPLGGWL
jgi:hypothetical protein